MEMKQQEESQHVNSGSASRGVKQGCLVLRFLLTAAGSSAWRKLKNCIKFLIGREPTFDETGLFLRQYVLHLTRIRPIRKITCTGLRSEGAGSQALMTMNAINFARSFGLPTHTLRSDSFDMRNARWKSGLPRGKRAVLRHNFGNKVEEAVSEFVAATVFACQPKRAAQGIEKAVPILGRAPFPVLFRG